MSFDLLNLVPPCSYVQHPVLFDVFFSKHSHSQARLGGNILPVHFGPWHVWEPGWFGSWLWLVLVPVVVVVVVVVVGCLWWWQAALFVFGAVSLIDLVLPDVQLLHGLLLKTINTQTFNCSIVKPRIFFWLCGYYGVFATMRWKFLSYIQIQEGYLPMNEAVYSMRMNIVWFVDWLTHSSRRIRFDTLCKLLEITCSITTRPIYDHLYLYIYTHPFMTSA